MGDSPYTVAAKGTLDFCCPEVTGGFVFFAGCVTGDLDWTVTGGDGFFITVAGGGGFWMFRGLGLRLMLAAAFTGTSLVAFPSVWSLGLSTPPVEDL